MKTIDKAKKLIRYLQNTKKSNIVTVYKKINTEDWKYLFYITGFYNNCYFSVDITESCIIGVEEIKIVHTTENVTEIYNLLTKYQLK